MKLRFLFLCTAAVLAFLVWQRWDDFGFVPDDLQQAKQPFRYVDVEQNDALAYLNFLRRQAGLKELTHSAALEASARNHARYLLRYPQEGHDELQSESPFFSGKKPADRAYRKGYLYKGVHENLSTSESSHDENSTDGFRMRQQTDTLMTAIYHRFSLLEQDIDEAGAAFEQNGRQATLVFNQGNRRFERLCAIGRLNAEPMRHYYRDVCHNGAIVYEDEVSAYKSLLYVRYPVGDDAVPIFHGERPDPMPGFEFTGNPLSIAFSPAAGSIRMLSFRLYQQNKEVTDTHVLSKSNDPNAQLSDRQFALFPLQPLEYDTQYRAVFEYLRDGRKEKAEWRFRTRKPEYPYFSVSGGERLAVETGKVYFLHQQGEWCLSECNRVDYRAKGGAKLDILERQVGGIVFKVRGKKGSSIRLPLAGYGREVTLYVVRSN